MRTVTFGGATSLDNFLARPDHAVDWLKWGPEVGKITGAYWKTVDTVVMGRKTYEVAVKLGMPAYPGVKNYVFSRTLKQVAAGPVELIADDAAAFVGRLKRKRGKGICVMGGGEFAHSLFEAGVIDEVGLNVHPVLLGTGIPAFLPMRRQIDLELIESTRFKNGCVYLRYRVRH